MESNESKKAALLYMYRIFCEHSDRAHQLLQKDIVNLLRSEYGIQLERKAVARNIDVLTNAGYDIRSGNKGYYLASRQFDDNEIRLLIDSVLSSRHISTQQTKTIIKKLTKLSSEHFRPRIKHIYTVDGLEKSENQGLFVNLDLIDKAIDDRKKVSFVFNSYGADKKLHEGAEHIVSPLRILMRKHRYYLLALERGDEAEPKFVGDPLIRLFALDMITNMRITDSEAQMHDIKKMEYDEFIDTYQNEFILPMQRPERVTFICTEASIGTAINIFGKKNLTFTKLPEFEHNPKVKWQSGNLRRHMIKMSVKTTFSGVRLFASTSPNILAVHPERYRKLIFKEHAERNEFITTVEAELEKVTKKK